MRSVKKHLNEIRIYWLIKRSGLFDSEYYLRNNLDVARVCVNPIMHYIRHGWREGRSPSLLFDTKWYLRHNPDVAQASINPLYHYLKHGINENRQPSPRFSTRDYLATREKTAKSNRSFLSQKRQQKNKISEREAVAHARMIVAEHGKRFSIILPTWNRKSVICRAIDSVIAQSYQNFELIIADDGSTDGTMPMVRDKYAHELESGRMRYLYNEHNGVSSARNSGVRVAKGEWIAYLDTDDTWRENFLLLMARAFINNPDSKTAYAQILIHDSVIEHRDYVLKGRFDSELIRKQNFISLIVYTHHREVYESCGAFDERMKRYVDWDMIIRHTSIFEPVYVPYVLADYERTDTLDNITFTESHKENKSILDWKNQNANRRIAIKNPAPDPKQAPFWGDYHLALALQRGLRKAGFTVRIDTLSEWYKTGTEKDDIILVMRGLSIYRPKAHQQNIMWNISHPDKISLDEYNAYDSVLVASDKHAEYLRKHCRVAVEVMHQFTDPDIFFSEFFQSLATDLLFVGNSRKQYRKAVKACVEQGLDADVYGTLWEGIIPERYIKGQFIDQKLLHAHYHSAKIVLNDHWDSMRDNGFFSNRIFDVVASEGFILTDNCAGIDELFGDAIAKYTDDKDLKCQVEYYLSHPEERAEMTSRLQKVVLRDHTLDKRIGQLLEVFGDGARVAINAAVFEQRDKMAKQEPREIEIYQTVISDEQLGHVQPPFIEYDVRKKNSGQEWHEYWHFLHLYNQKKNGQAKYWGNVSYRFTDKTCVTPQAFRSFIEDNPGYDVYFINPFEYLTYSFSSPWEQGDVWHPGLIEMTQTILDRLEYGIDIRKLKILPDQVAYCNYFVGNHKFWDRYIEFTRPIFDYIENCPDDKLVKRVRGRAYKTRPCSYHPFIMERMFSTFLAVQGYSILSFKYSYTMEQVLNGACQSYRQIAEAYNKLYEKLTQEEDFRNDARRNAVVW